jgi:hypothetical protein
VPRGDDSNALVSDCVGYVQEPVSYHPEPNVAVLAIVLAEICAFDSEDIEERQPGSFEAYAMEREVRRRFGIIQLEIIVSHDNTTAKP